MNENAAIAVIAAAWTIVQVTRATYTYRAAQKKADREAAKENSKP